MINPEKKDQSFRELLQTTIFPIIIGIVFFIWLYALIVSNDYRNSIFPLSIIMLFVIYFVSGSIYAGVLLGFLTAISFTIIVTTIYADTRLIFSVETLWLWSMYAILEYYRILFEKRHKGIIAEKEVLQTNAEILENKIDAEKKHNVSLIQRVSNYKYLGEITQQLSATMTEKEIILQITDLALKFIGKGSWEIIKKNQNNTFADYIKEYKIPILVQDINLDNRFFIENPDFHSLAAVPLNINDNFWGILIGTTNKENILDESDLRLLSILGGISSLALSNAHLYQENQKLAITDGLTGLYVNSYFKERLAQEIVRSKRYNLALSVAIIDIDHFKNINDTYGHDVGDEVIKHIASIIRKRLRATDFICRYGGEEFAIAMLQTEKSDGFKVAEDLRKLIQKEKFFIYSGNIKTMYINTTVSLGLTELTESTENEIDLIDMADKALYRAKNKGRNRTELTGKNK
ncbi:diguanylate cyclase [Elusimicrobiota bacterium]